MYVCIYVCMYIYICITYNKLNTFLLILILASELFLIQSYIRQVPLEMYSPGKLKWHYFLDKTDIIGTMTLLSR